MNLDKFNRHASREAYHVVYYLTIPTAIIVAYIYGLWWWLLAGVIYSKVLAVFGVQIGLHRYFSHRSFTTGKFRHIFLCWISLLAGEGSPIQWGTFHVHHHKNSDTSRDIHSPNVDTFAHATLYWGMESMDWFKSKGIAPPSFALLNDRYVSFVHKYWYIIWIILITVTLIISWKVCLFLLLFPAMFATLNSSVMTNGLAHLNLPGSYKNFELTDKSTNNKWIQAYQIGEGLHNNHHKYPGRYSQAVTEDEFDPVAWIIEKFFVENDPKSKYKL